MNNFIYHKSGSNEYEDKQTNITKLTLSSIVSHLLAINFVAKLPTPKNSPDWGPNHSVRSFLPR